MTEDSGTRRVDWKVCGDDLRQLRSDIRIHAISTGPRSLCGIDIESGTNAKVVALCVAGQVEGARARIRHHDRQAKLGGDALGAGLDDEVFLSAREAR